MNSPECQAEYLCRIPEGDRLIYVSSAAGGAGDGGYYDSFRLFVGYVGEPLRELVVRRVQHLRDGGTAYFDTAEGVFHA